MSNSRLRLDLEDFPAQAVHRNKIIVRVMRFGQIIYHPIGKTLNRMSQQKRNLEHVPIKSYDQITGQNKYLRRAAKKTNAY